VAFQQRTSLRFGFNLCWIYRPGKLFSKCATCSASSERAEISIMVSLAYSPVFRSPTMRRSLGIWLCQAPPFHASVGKYLFCQTDGLSFAARLGQRANLHHSVTSAYLSHAVSDSQVLTNGILGKWKFWGRPIRWPTTYGCGGVVKRRMSQPRPKRKAPVTKTRKVGALSQDSSIPLP
jgi:hypothetical protein